IFFSRGGSVSMDGEESQRDMNVDWRVGADRITDAWKITFGASFDYEQQKFRLDDDEEQPLTAPRREREVDALVVRSIDDHWSFGARGSLDVSSFNNIALSTAV